MLIRTNEVITAEKGGCPFGTDYSHQKTSQETRMIATAASKTWTWNYKFTCLRIMMRLPGSQVLKATILTNVFWGFCCICHGTWHVYSPCHFDTCRWPSRNHIKSGAYPI